jgi:formylglycine-generating enzyme required for sulfatase activity
MTNCGACLESCCTSLEVPGGTYHRTYDLTSVGLPNPPADGGPTGEADPSTVSARRIDKYAVTVGRFRQFVSAWNGGAGYTPPPGSGKHAHLNGGRGLANSGSAGTFEPGWVSSDSSNIAPTDTNLACVPTVATWTNSPGAQENLPINCVTWQEAYGFCIWDGGFLPSEAEWEFAAAGGSEQREYPWGAAAPGAGNQYAIYGCDYPAGAGTCTGVANIAEVGAAGRGVGRWGHLDMAGEIYNWSLDWYAPYVDPCTDCAYLTTASNRVIRGGYFVYDATYLIPANRGNYPQGRADGIGLRCGRTP